jgi:stage II sporulation protein GA (sporulation sigma-E factor processing peptidase)
MPSAELSSPNLIAAQSRIDKKTVCPAADSDRLCGTDFGILGSAVEDVGRIPEMVVYLDLVFLINLVIDGALLMLTAWTTRTAIVHWKLAAASVVGAAYAGLMLFPEMSYGFTLPVKAAFSLTMIGIAFGFTPVRRFMRLIGVFYLVNFAAAGCVLGMHYIWLSSGDVMNGVLYTHSGGIVIPLHVGLTLVVVGVPAGIWLYMRVMGSFKRKQAVAAYIAIVTVQIGDFQLECSGLIDTGNQLYDPLTKTPVIVMETRTWTEVLPPQWIARIRSCEADRIAGDIGKVDFAWSDRIRLVPFRGIGKGSGFMLALKPDRVTVTSDDRKFVTHRVLVGFDGGKLSSDDSYQAILHPMLLQEGAAG